MINTPISWMDLTSRMNNVSLPPTLPPSPLVLSGSREHALSAHILLPLPSFPRTFQVAFLCCCCLSTPWTDRMVSGTHSSLSFLLSLSHRYVYMWRICGQLCLVNWVWAKATDFWVWLSAVRGSVWMKRTGRSNEGQSITILSETTPGQMPSLVPLVLLRIRRWKSSQIHLQTFKNLLCVTVLQIYRRTLWGLGL